MTHGQKNIKLIFYCIQKCIRWCIRCTVKHEKSVILLCLQDDLEIIVKYKSTYVNNNVILKNIQSVTLYGYQA